VVHELNETYTRRQFLSRSAKAGAAVIAACGISYWLYDPNAPAPSIDSDSRSGFPDFSIPGIEKKMSIVRGDNRVTTLQAALKVLGGMETFIKKGDRVLLKVNAAFASPPMLSATTHPSIVSELTDFCYRSGAASVWITDNPINDPASCFGLSGIDEAARSAGAKVLLPEERFFEPTTLADGLLIRNWPVLYKPFENITKVIGVAPVKDHHRSGASMTMKNWYGLLGGRRNIFHQDIYNIIKELAVMVKPSLVVLDGTTTMMTNGPTGGSVSDLKPTNTMIVSTDQVAADAFGAGLLGKQISDLPYIGKAEAEGVGTANYRSLNPVELSV
jgi:uncharacterized protein (DUF362 family)